VAKPADHSDRSSTAHPWRRLALFLATAQCLTLVLLGVMLLDKHRQLLTDLTLSRIEVAAGDVRAALRMGLQTGLRPEEMGSLGPLLQAIRRDDPAVAAIEVFVTQGQTARIVHADDPRHIGEEVPTARLQALAGARGNWRGQDDRGPILGAAVRDEADELAGGLLVHAAGGPLAEESAGMAATLWPRIALAMATMLLVTLASLAWLRSRQADVATLRRRLMALALLTTVAAGVQVAWSAEELFAARLAPAVAAKVEAAAGFLATKIQRAVDLGIPLDRLPGVTESFAGFMVDNPEIAALRLADPRGKMLAERHTPAEAGATVSRAVGAAGQVSATADAGFVVRRLGELVTDIAVVLLVAVLVFRELLAALVGSLSAPTGSGEGAAERLQALRLPLFLFILTEEMSRAFLPLYFKEFAGGLPWLAKETEVGLPIAIYMLCFALATPFAGRWADRWGVTRVFAAGVVLSLLGFAWTALAVDYWQLLPARALCAWGYATGTMACQRQLILLSGPGERARGLALFVGAVGIAAICGSSLGGLLAGQVGFRPVFAISALLALLALAVFRLGGSGVTRDDTDHGETGPRLRLAEVWRLLRDRRFALLMIGGAIPAKLALAGFLFYLAPLALHQQDYGPAAIGRAVMLYFILVAAINPLASRLSDRYGWRLSLTIVGGAVIGAGGLAGLLGGEAAVWIGIASLGIGTGIATAPMQALASEVGAAAGATSVAVVLRTLERLGSVIGPLWAGVWFATAGWAGAMTAIGAAVLAGTLLCLAAGERSSA
jgi:predicted MFS family arabinose efflux permease